MKAARLRQIIFEAIHLLNSLGLKLKVLVLDQETTQQMVLKQDFHVTHHEPWLHLDGSNEKIYVVWDVPHLLKNVRSQIMKHILQVIGLK